MDIHQQIKTARERKQWSMERLAKEISNAEGLKKELAWQTVQQWENGTSAPKRTRIELVKQLLDIEDRKPATAPPAPGARFDELSSDERDLIGYWRLLLGKDRRRLLADIVELAGEREEERKELFDRAGVTEIAERAAHAARRHVEMATATPRNRPKVIDPSAPELPDMPDPAGADHD